VKTHTLESLAAVANEAHVCGQEAVRKSLSYFRTAGEALMEAKRQVGHGRWLTWLKENVVFSYRQASRYMLLARNWDELDGPSNLESALDALANGDSSRLAGAERRRVLEETRAAAAESVGKVCATVRQGDFRKVLGDVPDGSVDLIFTDPPYLPADLPLYDALGALASRVLKPAASLVTYCPTYNLRGALERVQPHVPFWSSITVRHRGGFSRMNHYHILARAKLLLWFVKGRYRGGWVLNLIDGDEPDKEAHDHQQGEGEASYCIERMCPLGGTVVDPMCGSGTTLLAALKLGRQALGCEIDKQRAKVALARVRQVHP
jgi:hypothetical protein